MTERKKHQKKSKDEKGRPQERNPENKAEEYIADHPNKKETSSTKKDIDYDKLKGNNQKE